jgi:hypothetical protein
VPSAVPNLGQTVMLTDAEIALVRSIAEAEGITEDEAASRLASQALARRVKRNTGKTPAKVYPMGRRH